MRSRVPPRASPSCSMRPRLHGSTGPRSRRRSPSMRRKRRRVATRPRRMRSRPTLVLSPPRRRRARTSQRWRQRLRRPQTLRRLRRLRRLSRLCPPSHSRSGSARHLLRPRRRSLRRRPRPRRLLCLLLRRLLLRRSRKSSATFPTGLSLHRPRSALRTARRTRHRRPRLSPMSGFRRLPSRSRRHGSWMSAL